MEKSRAKHPEKLLVPEYVCYDHDQAKGENSKTPSPHMDSKRTGQEETEENRQSCRQSPEQMVEADGVRLFSSIVMAL